MMARKTRPLLQLLLALCLLFGASLRAEEATISHEMPVADRGSSERIKASIRGFFEVLEALPGAPLDPQLRRDLAGEADSYLQGYRYLAREEQLYLQLFFDREAVLERVERERGGELAGGPGVAAPVAAPPALLWLGVTQGSLEALLTEGSRGLLPNTLAEVSVAQGQPLLLPADDALARGEVRLEQLRRGEVEPVLRASAKYGVERVLMGSLALVEGDQWSATWQIPGTGRRWRSNTGPLDAVLQQGLQGYRQLTARVPESGGRGFGVQDGQVSVRVSGVAAMADYIWVSRRLGELLGSDQVRPVQVGPDVVLFAVDAAGDAFSVQRALQGEMRLSPLTRALAGAGEALSADLNYLLH